MNFSVFMDPPATARPQQRPINCPEELREVSAVRNLSLKAIQRNGRSCSQRRELPLDVAITSTSIQDDHVVYHVTTTSKTTKNTSVVSYRYSEFLAFKNQIEELFTCDSLKCSGSCQAIRDFCSECFPKKRLVGSTSSRAISDRTHKLHTVLLHLLRCVLLPGSAMKCITARHALPSALFKFLGVKEAQDQRSLLQIYVDNRSAAAKAAKHLDNSSRSSSSSSDDNEDVASCKSYASTWDFEEDDAQCVICLDDLDTSSSCPSDCACEQSPCGSTNSDATATVTLPCHHSFHRECIFEWLLFEFHCPLCRSRVGPNAVTNYCRPKSRVQWWLGEFDEDPLASSD